jgi:hypothetical protein
MDTAKEILELVTNQKWINRNTVSGTLPDRDKIVELLAARAVLSQVTNQTVTEQDWRDENFGTDEHLGLDYLYVWLRAEYASDADVAAVFDYANSEFSYC